MNVLLLTAWTGNKGDELMLLAVRERLQALDPNIRMVRDHQEGTYLDRARLGFHHLLWPPRLTSFAGTVGYLAMKRYGKSFGIVPESEIDVVLNLAGFAYTDEWGPKNSEQMAEKFVQWRKQGTRIVMLPQSFGPFTNPRTIAAIRTMIDQCELVFARDPDSMEMLKGAVGDRPTLAIAPDFTDLVRGQVPPDFDASRPYCCIVPNYLMVRKTAEEESRKYIEFLSTTVGEIERRGLRTVLLLHTPKQDREFVEPLQAAVGRPMEVYTHDDPIMLKGVLGGSRLVVGSRFHALMSSLSQAVPSIGLGWSHKYEWQFREYDCPERLIRATAPREQVVELIAGLLDEPGRSRAIERLRNACANHERLTQSMWSEVEARLGGASKTNGHAHGPAGKAMPSGVRSGTGPGGESSS